MGRRQGKRKRTAAVQDASEFGRSAVCRRFWTAAALCRFDRICATPQQPVREGKEAATIAVLGRSSTIASPLMIQPQTARSGQNMLFARRHVLNAAWVKRRAGEDELAR